MSESKHEGGCHCGAIRYEVELDLEKPASRCNCSICTMMAATNAVVKPAAFHLVKGEADRGAYEMGKKLDKKFFCKHCGIHCFSNGFLKELGGEYVSVNLNTLDGIDPAKLTVIHWDGRHDNWEAGPSPTPYPVSG